MKTIKIILITIAVILGIFLAFAAIGMIVAALQYLLLFGIICLAGYFAIKLLKKPEKPQIEAKDPTRELDNATRTLEEYKQKLLKK